jgi:hypothetical protein
MNGNDKGEASSQRLGRPKGGSIPEWKRARFYRPLVLPLQLQYLFFLSAGVAVYNFPKLVFTFPFPLFEPI